jgi:hypothetical protein
MTAKLLVRRRNRASLRSKWRAIAFGGDAADVQSWNGDAQKLAQGLE